MMEDKKPRPPTVGSKVSQIATIFQSVPSSPAPDLISNTKPKSGQAPTVGPKGSGSPKADRKVDLLLGGKEPPGQVSVVRTQSHISRFHNARALFEKLGNEESRSIKPGEKVKSLSDLRSRSSSANSSLGEERGGGGGKRSPSRSPSPPAHTYTSQRSNGFPSTDEKPQNGFHHHSSTHPTQKSSSVPSLISPSAVKHFQHDQARHKLTNGSAGFPPGGVASPGKTEAASPYKPEKPERKFNSRELIEKQKNWTSHFSRTKTGPRYNSDPSHFTPPRSDPAKPFSAGTPPPAIPAKPNLPISAGSKAFMGRVSPAGLAKPPPGAGSVSAPIPIPTTASETGGRRGTAASPPVPSERVSTLTGVSSPVRPEGVEDGKSISNDSEANLESRIDCSNLESIVSSSVPCDSPASPKRTKSDSNTCSIQDSSPSISTSSVPLEPVPVANQSPRISTNEVVPEVPISEVCSVPVDRLEDSGVHDTVKSPEQITPDDSPNKSVISSSPGRLSDVEYNDNELTFNERTLTLKRKKSHGTATGECQQVPYNLPPDVSPTSQRYKSFAESSECDSGVFHFESSSPPLTHDETASVALSSLEGSQQTGASVKFNLCDNTSVSAPARDDCAPPVPPHASNSLSEEDSGFLSAEISTTTTGRPELCRGLLDVGGDVQFADEESAGSNSTSSEEREGGSTLEAVVTPSTMSSDDHLMSASLPCSKVPDLINIPQSHHKPDVTPTSEPLMTPDEADHLLSSRIVAKRINRLPHESALLSDEEAKEVVRLLSPVPPSPPQEDYLPPNQIREDHPPLNQIREDNPPLNQIREVYLPNHPKDQLPSHSKDHLPSRQDENHLPSHPKDHLPSRHAENHLSSPSKDHLPPRHDENHLPSPPKDHLPSRNIEIKPPTTHPKAKIQLPGSNPEESRLSSNHSYENVQSSLPESHIGVSERYFLSGEGNFPSSEGYFPPNEGTFPSSEGHLPSNEVSLPPNSPKHHSLPSSQLRDDSSPPEANYLSSTPPKTQSFTPPNSSPFKIDSNSSPSKINSNSSPENSSQSDFSTHSSPTHRDSILLPSTPSQNLPTSPEKNQGHPPSKKIIQGHFPSINSSPGHYPSNRTAESHFPSHNSANNSPSSKLNDHSPWKASQGHYPSNKTPPSNDSPEGHLPSNKSPQGHFPPSGERRAAEGNRSTPSPTAGRGVLDPTEDESGCWLSPRDDAYPTPLSDSSPRLDKVSTDEAFASLGSGRSNATLDSYSGHMVGSNATLDSYSGHSTTLEDSYARDLGSTNTLEDSKYDSSTLGDSHYGSVTGSESGILSSVGSMDELDRVSSSRDSVTLQNETEEEDENTFTEFVPEPRVEIFEEGGIHYYEDGNFWMEVEGLPDRDLELADNSDEGDVPVKSNTKVKFSMAPIKVYSTFSMNEYDRRNEDVDPVYSTFSMNEYDRRNEDVDPVAASAEYELEKRVEKLTLLGVELMKGAEGLGLSIIGMGVGADAGLEKLGIFVKTITEAGAAARDGRIQVNDQIIEVDGKSLVGVTQEYAASVLRNTSGLVRFLIGREKDPVNSEVAQLIRQSLQADKEREEQRRRMENYNSNNMGSEAPRSMNSSVNESLNSSIHSNADSLKQLLRESEAKMEKAQYDVKNLQARLEELEESGANKEEYAEKLRQSGLKLREVERSLFAARKEAASYQEMLEQSQGQYTLLEKKYTKAKRLIREFHQRELDLISREEFYQQLLQEKDMEYNSLVKALKDRVIQIEQELVETQKRAGLPVRLPFDPTSLKLATPPTTNLANRPTAPPVRPLLETLGAELSDADESFEESLLHHHRMDNAQKSATVERKMPNREPEKASEELDSAVPQHELLDSSLSRGKADLAARGRHLPSSVTKKTSGSISNSSSGYSLNDSFDTSDEGEEGAPEGGSGAWPINGSRAEGEGLSCSLDSDRKMYGEYLEHAHSQSAGSLHSAQSSPDPWIYQKAARPTGLPASLAEQLKRELAERERRYSGGTETSCPPNISGSHASSLGGGGAPSSLDSSLSSLHLAEEVKAAVNEANARVKRAAVTWVPGATGGMASSPSSLSSAAGSKKPSVPPVLEKYGITASTIAKVNEVICAITKLNGDKTVRTIIQESSETNEEIDKRTNEHSTNILNELSVERLNEQATNMLNEQTTNTSIGQKTNELTAKNTTEIVRSKQVNREKEDNVGNVNTESENQIGALGSTTENEKEDNDIEEKVGEVADDMKNKGKSGKPSAETDDVDKGKPSKRAGKGSLEDVRKEKPKRETFGVRVLHRMCKSKSDRYLAKTAGNGSSTDANLDKIDERNSENETPSVGNDENGTRQRGTRETDPSSAVGGENPKQPGNSSSNLKKSKSDDLYRGSASNLVKLFNEFKRLKKKSRKRWDVPSEAEHGSGRNECTNMKRKQQKERKRESNLDLERERETRLAEEIAAKQFGAEEIAEKRFEAEEIAAKQFKAENIAEKRFQAEELAAKQLDAEEIVAEKQFDKNQDIASDSEEIDYGGNVRGSKNPDDRNVRESKYAGINGKLKEDKPGQSVKDISERTDLNEDTKRELANTENSTINSEKNNQAIKDINKKNLPEDSDITDSKKRLGKKHEGKRKSAIEDIKGKDNTEVDHKSDSDNIRVEKELKIAKHNIGNVGKRTDLDKNNEEEDTQDSQVIEEEENEEENDQNRTNTVKRKPDIGREMDKKTSIRKTEKSTSNANINSSKEDINEINSDIKNIRDDIKNIKDGMNKIKDGMSNKHGSMNNINERNNSNLNESRNNIKNIKGNMKDDMNNKNLSMNSINESRTNSNDDINNKNERNNTNLNESRNNINNIKANIKDEMNNKNGSMNNINESRNNPNDTKSNKNGSMKNINENRNVDTNNKNGSMNSINETRNNNDTITTPNTQTNTKNTKTRTFHRNSKTSIDSNYVYGSIHEEDFEMVDEEDFLTDEDYGFDSAFRAKIGLTDSGDVWSPPNPQDSSPYLSSKKETSYHWQNVPVPEWSKEQVCQWLMALGLEAYTGKFFEAPINGISLLQLERNDFKALGVQGEDKNRLKRKLKDLKVQVEKEKRFVEKEKKEKEKLMKKAEKLAEKASKRK
ncbi:hypothetical protein M8J75_001359 [Diaphorina citri]|nr:hypothetical protein M8J75_001359 [Diaphorina citri]